MTVLEALADAFVAEGVDTSFVYLGDGNMYFIPRLADRGVAVYSVRHENWAVAMADGYHRRSGRLGFASVTLGPGITQIATSLMVAARRRTPMVVMTGEPQRTADDSGIQAMDQQRFVESSGAMYQSVRSLQTMADDVHTAFYRARTERLPVVLGVPVDFRGVERPEGWAYRPSTAAIPDAQSVAAPKAVAVAADLLAAAERPIVVAGRGATAAGVPAALEQLAERTGALLSSTLGVAGLFAGDPFDLGVAGGYSTATAAPLFAEADVVLAVGASLNYFTSDKDRLFPDATLISVNPDPFVRVNGRRAPAHALQGHAGPTVAALLAALPERGSDATGYRTDAVRAAIAIDPREAELATTVELEPGRVDPRHVVAELDRELPDDCLVVAGIGHFGTFVPRFITWSRTRQFIQTTEFGVIGQALSTGLGASIAAGRTPTVVVEGDASILMAIQELDTVVRHDLPVLIVVMNDAGLGAELHRLVHDRAAWGLAQLPSPDLAEVARSFGLEGATAETAGDVEAATASWARDPRPFLIDARVSQRVVYERLVAPGYP